MGSLQIGAQPTSYPDWPDSTPGQGLHTGARAAPMQSMPRCRPRPTLPATAAVLLYDPDEPGGLIPAGQGPLTGPVSGARGGDGPPTSHPLASACDPGFVRVVRLGGWARGFATGLSDPAGSAGGDGPRYPEVNREDSRPSGTAAALHRRPHRPGNQSGRDGAGVVGGAGPGGRSGRVAGHSVDDTPRGGTFKIWLALTLAAGGLIGAVLWLLPLMWPGLPRRQRTKRLRRPATELGGGRDRRGRCGGSGRATLPGRGPDRPAPRPRQCNAGRAGCRRRPPASRAGGTAGQEPAAGGSRPVQARKSRPRPMLRRQQASGARLGGRR